MNILRIVFILLFFCIYNKFSFCDEGINEKCNNTVYQNNQVIANKKLMANKQNGFIKFVKNYLVPDLHPIFKEQYNEVSIFGGYDINDLINGPVEWKKLGKQNNIYNNLVSDNVSNSFINRKSYSIGISYSKATKIAMLNGRFSVGFFGFYVLDDNIQDTLLENLIAVNRNLIIKTIMIGGDCIQELVFGHHNLYFSFGIGFSYIFYVDVKYKNKNNQNADFLSINGTQYFNSKFNFVGKIALGHRFDFGLIVEATWKYYTNGGLAEYNRPFSVAGLTVGFVF